MSPRQPQLRQKSNGAWFVRWNRRDHYLSTDQTTARALFLEEDSTHPGSLAAWRRWRASRDAQPTLAAARAARRTHGGSGAPARPTMTLAEAADRMVADYTAAGRDGAARFWRGQLDRFIEIHGAAKLRELTTADERRGRFQPPIVTFLINYRTDMLAAIADAQRTIARGKPLEHKPLSPASINHDLKAVKRLIGWCHDQGLCRAVNWRSVRRVPEPPPTPQPIPHAELKRTLNALLKHDPDATPPPTPHLNGRRLAPWLALAYLTGVRAGELVQLVGSVTITSARTLELATIDAAVARVSPVQLQGRTLDRFGSVELIRHKTAWREHQRFVLLTPEARWWLARCRPYWKTPDGLNGACEALGVAGWCSRLRDTAASDLRAAGVAEADVDRFLGHAQRGVLQSYARTPTHALWASARTLAATLAPVRRKLGEDLAGYLSSLPPISHDRRRRRRA